LEPIENLGRDEVAGGDTMTAAMTAVICCVWIRKRTTRLASNLFEQTAQLAHAHCSSEAAASAILSLVSYGQMAQVGRSGADWAPEKIQLP
jgi:ADP-ribosylglycohydrolase